MFVFRLLLFLAPALKHIRQSIFFFSSSFSGDSFYTQCLKLNYKTNLCASLKYHKTLQGATKTASDVTQQSHGAPVSIFTATLPS